MRPVQTLFEELIKSDAVLETAWQKAITTDYEESREGFTSLEAALTEVVQSFVYDGWELLNEEGGPIISSDQCQRLLRESLVRRKPPELLGPREQEIVQEMMNLVFARIHRLVRSYNGNENPSFDEDVLLFSDEVVFYTAAFCYLRTLRNYLQNSRQMVILTEGRSLIDSLFKKLGKITDLLNIVRSGLGPNQKLAFYERRIQRVIEEYFARYSVEMRVEGGEMNWGFLHGVLERLSTFTEKSVNRVNRIAVAYHGISLARMMEEVLAATPSAKSNNYRLAERLAYEKMIRDLLFLKNSAQGDEMSLSHVEI